MAVLIPPGDEFDAILSSGITPRLLLHCCCAPCASYVIEYLSPLFLITALFYNPNIQAREEYDKRAAELRKLLMIAEYPSEVEMEISDYEAASFEDAAAPFWDEPEGGRRCRACFELRLGATASRAKKGGFEFFASTLSVSPHKNAALLNDIGGAFAEKYGVNYLHSDFKKRNGYSRSVELSKQYGLYRQNYCGCLPKT